MKIVQAIETSGPGGAEQVLIRLCRELRERGHQVRALLLKPGWLAGQLEQDGIPVSVLPLDRPVDRRFLHALRRFILGFEDVH